MLERRLRIGPWVRASSMGQVYAESPETHIEGAEEWAESHNAEIVTWFRLDGIPGADSLNHAEARRMKYLAKNGHLNAVLFTSLSRLGRDLLLLVQIQRELESYGVRIISIMEEIDTSTASGLDRFYDMARQAEIEVKRLSERVRRGNAMRRRRGEVISKPPYGYRKENKKLVVDEIQGPIRARIYHLYLEHKRIKSVVKILNDEKIPAPGLRIFNKDARWTSNTVRRLLRDTTAMGIYTCNRYYGRNNKMKPQDQWVEQSCPPLIDKERFLRVQGLMDANERNQPTRKPRTAYAGLMVCHCGVKIRYRKANPKIHLKARYHCPACGNSIRYDDFDELMGRVIKGFHFNDLPASAHWQPSEDARWQQLEGIEKELNKLQSQRKNLLLLATQSTTLSAADFDAEYQPLLDRQKTLEDDKSRLESELALHSSQAVDQERLTQILSNLTWGDLLPDEKAELLRAFVIQIVLAKTSLIIQHRGVTQRVVLTDELPIWGASAG